MFQLDYHVDIDECSFDNGGCNQTCTNTTGSYKCSCDEGFKLNPDDHGCDGINIIINFYNYYDYNCRY